MKASEFRNCTIGKVKLKFTKTHHLLCRARINGIKATLLLDSGSSICCLDSDKQEHYGINSNGDRIQATSASGDNFPVKSTEACELILGRYHLGMHQFVLFDMSRINQELTNQKSSKIDGLIGGQFLKDRKAIIDYRNMKMYFSL